MKILITGASSGIGAAIAIEYSRYGHTLFLFGRNSERLNNILQECIKNGAKKVFTYIADVVDKNHMQTAIQTIIDSNDIDIVFANAGISSVMTNTLEETKQIESVMQTNIFGVLNTIQPFIESMCKKKSGHIVVISSMASFMPIPQCPAYCASKVVVRFYSESLYPILLKNNVNITTICPGYIKTPLTDKNNFYMPFLMSPEKAAKIIIKKLQKKPIRIIFPNILYFGIMLILLIPSFLRGKFMIKVNAKKNDNI